MTMSEQTANDALNKAAEEARRAFYFDEDEPVRMGDEDRVRWRHAVRALVAERDTLAAEVKRLTDTAEHLGANLKTARADLADAQAAVRRMAAAAVKREDEAASHARRAARLEAGIDALVDRYSDLQRGAR
jgi:chromosome segregation ATPase